MANVAILASGGMKAAVAAAAASAAADNDLVFVHVHYGQPSAAAERAALRAFAGTFASSRVLMLGLPHLLQLHKATLSKDREPAVTRGEPGGSGRSPLLSPASLAGMMPTVFLLGVQSALRVGATKLLTGLTQFGDATHLGQPAAVGPRGDRRAFLHAFNIMLESVLPERSSVVVEAPLIDLNCVEIIKLANRFRVPFEKTWSCEKSAPQPCHSCEACKARAGGFVEAGLVDPLVQPVREPK